MFTVESLKELCALGGRGDPVYVGCRGGPGVAAQPARDHHESGCRLPGIPANPLDPEPWWARPPEQWVARQLQRYAHLAEEKHYAWVLTGVVVGPGPGSGPQRGADRPVARLTDQVVHDATRLYQAVLDR